MLRMDQVKPPEGQVAQYEEPPQGLGPSRVVVESKGKHGQQGHCPATVADYPLTVS